MINLILFDIPTTRQNLLPLTYTRPICELRIGILTIKEKWERYLNTTATYLTAAYLTPKFPLKTASTNLLINGSVLPTPQLVEEILHLKEGELLVAENKTPIAVLANAEQVGAVFQLDIFQKHQLKQSTAQPIIIQQVWELFRQNGAALKADFDLLTKGRISQPISSTNMVLGAENIFLEAGATVECSILNGQTGPIYVGHHATIMEGCIVRGGLAMWDKAVLKMGAKIYGPTTLGTYCKVGGEVNNTIFIAYSNKGHDGFIGNSVIGEWCNLGADTNNSNLKNNYAPVKLWNYSAKRFLNTGLQFCGLIMGDHSKSGINTMFNTGTVIGVSCNIFGAGFPRNFVPSFSWGGPSGYKTYRINKAFEVAERMMARRKVTLTEADKAILNHIFETSASFRRS